VIWLFLPLTRADGTRDLPHARSPHSNGRPPGLASSIRIASPGLTNRMRIGKRCSMRAICWPRSTTGSPKASTPWTWKARNHALTSWRH